MVSHHASHRGRYVRPPTPRSAPGRPPRRDRRPRACRPTATADPERAAPPRPPTPRVPRHRHDVPPRFLRPPRRPTAHPAAWSAIPASCFDVPRRPRASGPGDSRCGTIPELPTGIVVTRGPDRSRARPHPWHAPPPPRHSATPAPRHPAQPALRVASRCGQFLPGVAPSCASPGTPGPGSGAAAPARSCRHECATTRAHGAWRTSARHGPDATCTSALPSPAPLHAGACGRRRREPQPARASRRAVP
ncbi:hypothetical protein ACVJ1F_000753 [Frigoribacterium sp. 2355]